MTRRYKEAACIYCGTLHTSNAEHPLCPQCRDDIRLGRERRKEVEVIRAEGGLKDVWLGDRWLHPDERYFKEKLDATLTRSSVMTAILTMCGATTAERGDGRWEGRKYIEHPDAVRISDRHNAFHGDEGRSAVLPAGRVDALRDFTERIQRLVSYEYVRGFNEGNSFLLRTARGDVSIEALNEVEKKRGRSG